MLPEASLLDTSVVIDLPEYQAAGLLTSVVAVSAVTFAELSYGVALASTRFEAVARARRLAELKRVFRPLAFDAACADAYGDLAALVRDAGRAPRPRRIDIMIASVAVANRLPLMTANPDDFKGMERLLELLPTSCHPQPSA
jgi:predicted nucleic acid-binding protein